MNESIPQFPRSGSIARLQHHTQDAAEDRRYLLGQFIARWKSITAVFLISVVLGLYVVASLPKKYTATTVLALDPRRNHLVEGPASLASAQWDTVVVSNEVSLLQLPALALDVVRHLRLTTRPEYQRKEAGRVASLIAQLKRTLLMTPDETDTQAGSAVRQEEEQARAELSRNLRVTNEARTYTMRVSYTSTDPVHAAEVANAIAELHILAQQNARMQSIREASVWLNREIGALQERVSSAEAAELAYRKQHGLGDERAISSAQQEVNALTLQITLASAERAQAEANLQEATAGVMTSLRESVRVAKEREANVRRQLTEAQIRLDQVLAAEAGLRALARESSASRMLLEDLLRRARTADSQLAAPRAEARIVSRALVPTTPSNLGPTRLVPGVLGGSAALAIAFGFLMIKLQSGFRSIEEAERRLGVEGIGEIPKVPDATRRLLKLVLEQPSSHVAESIRSVCGRFSKTHGSSPIILVTSPAPGDGKTALAAALAQSFALSTQNCLFIDADFRRPSAHRVVGAPCQVGLCEVLAGTVPLDKALVKLVSGTLTFLPAGDVVRDPLDLLSPERLAAFVTMVRMRFDIIVLDSPPVLPIVDAVRLAAHADHVLLAIRWQATTRAAAARAITLLRRNGTNNPYLVLTGVDQVKTSRYEEGRYGMDLSYAGRAWIQNAGMPADRRAGRKRHWKREKRLS